MNVKSQENSAHISFSLLVARLLHYAKMILWTLIGYKHTKLQLPSCHTIKEMAHHLQFCTPLLLCLLLYLPCPPLLPRTAHRAHPDVISILRPSCTALSALPCAARSSLSSSRRPRNICAGCERVRPAPCVPRDKIEQQGQRMGKYIATWLHLSVTCLLLSSLNRDDKRECGGGANKGNASRGERGRDCAAAASSVLCLNDRSFRRIIFAIDYPPKSPAREGLGQLPAAKSICCMCDWMNNHAMWSVFLLNSLSYELIESD